VVRGGRHPCIGIRIATTPTGPPLCQCR
jgi:hypothetical protein